MNKRAITCLLAALLSIASASAIPVAGRRTVDAGTAIVWIVQQRAEQPVECEIPDFPGAPAIAAIARQNPQAARQFAPFLYQRPPPSPRLS